MIRRPWYSGICLLPRANLHCDLAHDARVLATLRCARTLHTYHVRSQARGIERAGARGLLALSQQRALLKPSHSVSHSKCDSGKVRLCEKSAKARTHMFIATHVKTMREHAKGKASSL